MAKPKNKFPYNSITSKKYLNDRDEFFRQNGNGWWYTDGIRGSKKYDITEGSYYYHRKKERIK